jgi:hypothetical protein
VKIILSQDGDFPLIGRLGFPCTSAIIVNTAVTSAGAFGAQALRASKVNSSAASASDDRHRVDQFRKSGLAAVSDLTESCP